VSGSAGAPGGRGKDRNQLDLAVIDQRSGPRSEGLLAFQSSEGGSEGGEGGRGLEVSSKRHVSPQGGGLDLPKSSRKTRRSVKGTSEGKMVKSKIGARDAIH